MTVGGLAAGMAHEINNPLGAIVQAAQNAERRLLGDLPGNMKAAKELEVSFEDVRRYVRERKIDKWYNKCGFEIVDFSGKEEIFINVNSEEELLQYENEIRKRLLG